MLPMSVGWSIFIYRTGVRIPSNTVNENVDHDVDEGERPWQLTQ